MMANEKCSSVYLRHKFLRHEYVRKRTFQDWPNKNFDFRSLVKAGFYYSKNSDEVICYSCGIRVCNWSKDSHAYFMHRALSNL